MNLLTNFPVESPAILETTASLCEGRNGVPSIQIHETRAISWIEKNLLQD